VISKLGPEVPCVAVDMSGLAPLGVVLVCDAGLLALAAMVCMAGLLALAAMVISVAELLASTAAVVSVAELLASTATVVSVAGLLVFVAVVVCVADCGESEGVDDGDGALSSSSSLTVLALLYFLRLGPLEE